MPTTATAALASGCLCGVRALVLKDSGRTAVPPKRAATLIPPSCGHGAAVAKGAQFPCPQHHRSWRNTPPGCAGSRLERVCIVPRARPGTWIRTHHRAHRLQLRALGHRVDIERRGAGQGSLATSNPACPRPRACRPGVSRASMPPTSAPVALRYRRQPCVAATWPRGRISHLEARYWKSSTRSPRAGLGLIVMTPFAQLVITAASGMSREGVTNTIPRGDSLAIRRFANPNVPPSTRRDERIDRCAQRR